MDTIEWDDPEHEPCSEAPNIPLDSSRPHDSSDKSTSDLPFVDYMETMTQERADAIGEFFAGTDKTTGSEE